MSPPAASPPVDSLPAANTQKSRGGKRKAGAVDVPVPPPRMARSQARPSATGEIPLLRRSTRSAAAGPSASQPVGALVGGNTTAKGRPTKKKRDHEVQREDSQ
jgi:hypothetical protein